MNHGSTHLALAAITDEGLFERIATAVLRVADPLGAALLHPGVNADGRTRKSPLDGVGFVRGAVPRHLVTAHHTITDVAGLRSKWLHDPSQVKPRNKTGRPTAPAGDVVKTAEIVAAERKRTPGARATLFLTCNSEPDETLVRDVVADGAERGLEVEVWSRSRLAHVLDHTADGQSVRRQMLGTPQERLSKDLLQTLSQLSLERSCPYDDPRAWVPRHLDTTLAQVRSPLTFLTGPSGFGKTVACYRFLDRHVSQGGFALVLPHETVAEATSLDQAVTRTLRALEPSLAAAESPFIFSTPDQPFLVLVEDINRSGQAQRLCEKLLTWAAGAPDKGTAGKPWRLLCPIWPQIVTALGSQARRGVEPRLLTLPPMTAEEGARAVDVRATLAGKPVTAERARAISTALGHDPLLIALHDPDRAPDPHGVIDSYVEDTLGEAEAAGCGAAADLRAALMAIGREILARRQMEPAWRDIGGWSLTPADLDRLRRLGGCQQALRLEGPSTDQRLTFRHDRVRDWLLVQTATELDLSDQLHDEIITEPYFATILGAMAVARAAPDALLARLASANPLSLFHALRLTTEEGEVRTRIVKAALAWIELPESRTSAHRHLRWAALRALSATDAPEVLTLVRAFPEDVEPGQMARLRNGDIAGGIDVCLRIRPGTTASFRDRQIDHAFAKFGSAMIEAIDQALREPGLNDTRRVGLLRLSGHLGQAELGGALEACWAADAEPVARLKEYLWALARCCDHATAAARLDPILKAWSDLPGETDETHGLSPRNSLAADDVRMAFGRQPPAVVEYFIDAAPRFNLEWEIAYMLHATDSPAAVCHLAKTIGSQVIFRSTAAGHWQRAQEGGAPMSAPSRTALLHLWQDTAAEPATRRGAFALWAATELPEDLTTLAAANEDRELADVALRERLQRGDPSAIPQLSEKLSDEGRRQHWWWSPARGLCAGSSRKLEGVLDAALAASAQMLASGDTDGDRPHLLQDILTRIPPSEAESLLLRHWDGLKMSRCYVQSALYVASPRMLSLVEVSVAEADDPKELFKYISSKFGIREHRHPGVTRPEQMVGLKPYRQYLEKLDVSTFAEACVDAGWVTLRNDLWGKLLEEAERTWTPARAVQTFDRLASEGARMWIELEVENAFRSGLTWAEFIGQLRDWLAQRRSHNALALVARALVHRGSRADLAILAAYGAPQDAADASLIADTTFEVRRRSAA